MKPKLVSQIILPNIQAGMTGVWRILRAHDLVTLEYTDGTREHGKVSTARWQEIHENPFAIVSEIQSQRVRAVNSHAALCTQLETLASALEHFDANNSSNGWAKRAAQQARATLQQAQG